MVTPEFLKCLAQLEKLWKSGKINWGYEQTSPKSGGKLCFWTMAVISCIFLKISKNNTGFYIILFTTERISVKIGFPL